jgi:hypothetical protein
MEEFLKKYYKVMIFLALAFMFVVSALNANNDSAIFDETAHIGAGYSYVTQHEMRLNPEHPPLIKDLAGIPLLFMKLNFDTTKPFWTGDLTKKWDDGQWASGRHLLYEAGNDPDKVIFWARLPIVLLSIIFGLFIFKWARELAGLSAGLMALALYAFDPNILGHNHFVTTDIGIAAFMTFAFYYFLKFVKDPSPKNVLLAGLFLGLLQLAKFSSITAFPVLFLAAVTYPLVKKYEAGSPGKWRELGKYVVKGLAIFGISIVVVWLLYAANTFDTTKEMMNNIIEFNFPHTDTQASHIFMNKGMHFLNSNPATRPLTEYLLGIGYVFRRVAGGNGAYFMGEVSSTAFRSYFPTVFAIKEPIVSLLLMLFALLLALARSMRKPLDPSVGCIKNTLTKIVEYLRNNIVEASMFAFVVLYAYVSITGNLNIGFRHLFPILPFVYILTAKNVSKFLERSNNGNGSFVLKTVFALLFVVLMAGTVLSYPSYTSYFNQLAGGSNYGYHYVTDSNADWGQDLKRLKIFLDEHPEIEKIHVDYFGGGDIKYYIGEKYLMWWDSKRPIETGWYAISANFLMGSIYEKSKTAADSYQWLKDRKPDYQAGTSILIYNITEEDLKNIKQ